MVPELSKDEFRELVRLGVYSSGRGNSTHCALMTTNRQCTIQQATLSMELAADFPYVMGRQRYLTVISGAKKERDSHIPFASKNDSTQT